MVCAKCAAKEASSGSSILAAPDAWKPAGKGAGERGGDRAIGVNKLLQSKRRMKVAVRYFSLEGVRLTARDSPTWFRI
jgi:hypothetical protein